VGGGGGEWGGGEMGAGGGGGCEGGEKGGGGVGCGPSLAMWEAWDSKSPLNRLQAEKKKKKGGVGGYLGTVQTHESSPKRILGSLSGRGSLLRRISSKGGEKGKTEENLSKVHAGRRQLLRQGGEDK